MGENHVDTVERSGSHELSAVLALLSETGQVEVVRRGPGRGYVYLEKCDAVFTEDTPFGCGALSRDSCTVWRVVACGTSILTVTTSVVTAVE